MAGARTWFSFSVDQRRDLVGIVERDRYNTGSTLLLASCRRGIALTTILDPPECAVSLNGTRRRRKQLLS
jgi:hypothetical protein